MGDLKDLGDRANCNMAQIVIRINDLMEVVRSEQPDCIAFKAAEEDWRKGFIKKLIQYQRRLRQHKPEPPHPEREPGPVREALVSTLKEMVTTNQKVMETMAMREPAANVKAAFPKLQVQAFKVFSGNLKDYPGW